MNEPGTQCIVLGRFQPFHKGHEYLVEKAHEFAIAHGLNVVIAIGSAQAGYEPDNPWTSEERLDMIQQWCKNTNIDVQCVCIDDINDEQRWVEYAGTIHGEGVLVTSNEPTATLYEREGKMVQRVELNQRDTFEGWRVRQTMKMLSTVDDQKAVQMVLNEILPGAITSWMIENDALFRLSTFETGVHAG